MSSLVFLRTRGCRRVVASVAITIGLGVGAAMAVLSVYRNVFLPTRSYDDPAHLVVLENRGAYTLGPGLTTEHQALSWPDYQDLEARQHSFESVGALTAPERLLAGIGGRFRYTSVTFVSADLFSVLGVRAIEGRTLGAADFKPDAPPVAVLTEGLRHRISADPAVLGRSISVEGQPVIVVGVVADDVVTSLKQRSEIFEESDQNQRIILPLVASGARPASARLALRQANRVSPMLTVVARLRPGASVSSGQNDVARISVQLSREFPESNAGRTFDAAGLNEWITQDVRHLRPMLVMIAVLALLVACASAVGLMMTDVVRREPEMAVRHALGASLGRLIRLVLQRSVLWSLPAALVGLAFAWTILRWIDVLGTEGSTAIRFSARPEVFGSALGLAAVAGVLLAIVGAWMLWHQDFAAGLKEAATWTSASRRRRTALNIVVALQVTTATSLGFVSLLLVRSLVNVYDVDLGFEPGDSFLFRVQLPQEYYRSGAEQTLFFENALSRVRAVPGVASVALGDSPPLAPVAVTLGSRDFALELPGRAPEALPPLSGQRVSVDYFATLGMRVLRGRAFSVEDVTATAPVAIVDDGFWRARFGGIDPLQASLRIADTRYSIVGVVAGVKQSGPTTATRPMMYLPRETGRNPAAYFVVRPSGSARAVMERVASEVAGLDGRVFVDDPEPLAVLLQRNLAARQRMLRLLAIAASIVLLLTAFSIAGTLGEFVEQKVREIALRKALGASGRDTVLLVCGNLALPASAGIVLGSIGGVFLAKALSGELFGVQPLDALTLSGTVLGLVALAVAAAVGPMTRALWIDPARVLRML